MQQFSFIHLYTDLFESALHVSGNKLAHLQEHFSLYIQLLYNAPIKLYIQSKVLLKMGELVARNMQSRFK